jgi:hypothetical protein
MTATEGGGTRRRNDSSAEVRKLPDDPDIRVDLAESFRQDVRGQKLARVAKRVRSPRGEQLHRSSLYRYVSGTLAPTLQVARRLAAAVGKPLGEVVGGLNKRHHVRTEAWTRHLLNAPAYRRRSFVLLDAFSIVLRHIHFGPPTDRSRQQRKSVSPSEGRVAFAYFEVRLASPVETEPVDFIVSFRAFERPEVYSDYGLITLTATEIRGVELWTRRSHQEKLTQPEANFWVQTWIDGGVTEFIVRSGRPFTLGPMIWREQLPQGRLVVVPFHPGGMHRYAPEEGQ